MNKNKVKIGVGGALIQFHPTYHKLLELKLKALAPKNVEVGDVEVDLIRIMTCLIVLVANSCS